MGRQISRLAALLAFLSTAAAAHAAQSAALRGAGASASSVRTWGGASAQFTVSARIIRQSASIGADRGPPAPHMVARPALVSASDGRDVPAMVYDFE